MKISNFNKGNLYLSFLSLIIFLLLFSVYDDTIKHPFDSPSPSASGKLFYLFLYYLDKFLGKFGVFAFFGFWFLFFLYKGVKWGNNNKNG